MFYSFMVVLINTIIPLDFLQLLHLCEVESVSFLDVAASTTAGLTLAKSTIFQVSFMI